MKPDFCKFTCKDVLSIFSLENNIFIMFFIHNLADGNVSSIKSVNLLKLFVPAFAHTEKKPQIMTFSGHDTQLYIMPVQKNT